MNYSSIIKFLNTEQQVLGEVVFYRKGEMRTCSETIEGRIRDADHMSSFLQIVCTKFFCEEYLVTPSSCPAVRK